MVFVADPLPGGQKAKCLLVLLPGAKDRAGTFRDERFIDVIRSSGLSVDVVAADATLGYYLSNRAGPRLEADVIGPARSKGYEQVWLLGISMGGYGTFHYTLQFPEHVDGIAAFAPYLGEEELVKEVKAAGGVKKWAAPAPAPLDETNHARQLWGYLQRVTAGEQKAPEIYLGCGDTDRMLPSVKVLAAALPADHVFTTAGGHDWGPWRDLLAQFLARSAFKDRCAQ